MTTEEERAAEVAAEEKQQQQDLQTMSKVNSPYSELEMQFLLTQPGYDNIKLNELLSYYTRDLRMGNLSRAWGEDAYVKYWLSFGGDLLREGLQKSFLSALARSADVLEVSQSIGGFFRRRGGTVTHEKIERAGKGDGPEKRNLMGGKRTY